MKPIWIVRILSWGVYVAVIAFAAGTAWLYWHPAQADERGDWFRSLKQPDTGVSCCDISDCRRTQARWADGKWIAIVRGHPRVVPQSKIVRSTPTIDGEAYICAGEGGPAEMAPIYCFVPPGADS